MCTNRGWGCALIGGGGCALTGGGGVCTNRGWGVCTINNLILFKCEYSHDHMITNT